MKKYKAPFEEKDGGYYFPDYDIHVAAVGLEKAKQIIKETHGVDIDADPTPKTNEEVDE